MKSTLHFGLGARSPKLARSTIRQKPTQPVITLTCACGCGTVFQRRALNGTRAFVDRAHWYRAVVKKGTPP